jgi:hypothetical protein
MDLQADVDGHAKEFEKVIDFLVTVQYACLRDPNAPGSAAGILAADTVRTGVSKAHSGRLSRYDKVHGYNRASGP